jgi:hypothetical protein
MSCGRPTPEFLEWQSDEAGVVVALRTAPDGAYRAVHMALGPADEPDVQRYLTMYEAAGGDLRPAERKRLEIARRRAGLG